MNADYCAQRGWGVRRESNGFLAYYYAQIPMGDLRQIRKAVYRKEAYLGGKTEYTGSGRGLLRLMLRQTLGWNLLQESDPLVFLSSNAHERRRQQARAFSPAVQKAWERACEALRKRRDEREALEHAKYVAAHRRLLEKQATTKQGIEALRRYINETAYISATTQRLIDKARFAPTA